MSAVQNDTLSLKINHCVNRAAPVSIYRDWPASLHMLRPITEKVHSGNGSVSLVDAVIW